VSEKRSGVSGWKLTDDYVRSVGRIAYLWGWPLVNVHNRLSIMSQLPGPGLIGGVIPAASPGSVGMLHDYVTPDQKLVACPNQDVVYGFGLIDGRSGPSVVQVPEFEGRFWVYQMVNQRTDSFVQLGAMYGAEPGHYLIAPAEWDGAVPDGIAGEFRFDTRLVICAPRIFMDDTAEDRAAIQPFLNQVMLYPLAEYTGEMKTTDWSNAPIFPAGDTTSGEQETQWVVPEQFFAELPGVLDEVPPLPGEDALYAWIRSLLAAAERSDSVASLLREVAVDANETLVSPLFQFRNIGIPLPGNWTTQRNGAAFGTDYLSRTAMGKANILVNTPRETTYFYQDLDEAGERLDGSRNYTVTFPSGALPPVKGFWSLTLYNEHHFFHSNDLNRYSLGTKNKNLHRDDDGSLTLLVSHDLPEDQKMHANWLPAPEGAFSLYLRAYWPESQVMDGTWTPPGVSRQG
jgi:hypothetical protein